VSGGAPGGGASGGSASGGGASGSGGSSGMTGTAGSSGNAGAGGASTSNCPATDPLKTNKAKQDAYDCSVLQVSAKWGMPDPMIVKCQIQQESSFNVFSISGDSPCGIMQGWTDAESKSFGLIQTTPACGEAKSALLPNGHPNLDQDMSSALWATSVFNPTINLDEGVKTDTDSLKALEKKYAGCTDAQYNMMAAGAFNSGDNAVLGCGMYNARAQMYVDAITSHYHQFALAAGWPDPY
jgi:transglycosylase-like protein with SLT domain